MPLSILFTYFSGRLLFNLHLILGVYVGSSSTDDDVYSYEDVVS